MNKIFSIWFHQLGISNSIKLKIYNQIMDFEAIFKLSSNNYSQLGLNQQQIDKIVKSKETIDSIRETLEQMIKENIRLTDIGDEKYPEELKQIADPPMALFAQGDIQCLNKPTIAVVGARKCSEYGFEMAKKLSKELAQRGIVVVSGMALGIDEAAHRGALEVGQTVAVLGTGVSVCYPKKNYELYRRIPAKGCLISEYLPHTEPMSFQFPQRNRIISGISVGTVLVEAAEKSGSLITADLALEQNKLVFAVPGNINSKLSKGTNNLIQQGAKLITNSQDIIDELPSYIMKKIDSGDKNLTKLNCNLLDKVEIMVYDCLSWQPKEINELITSTGITSETINTILLKLEIKGLIQRLPGNRYLRLN